MSGNIANLDEAEKCRELGKSFLRAGEWAKAVKFFDKSLRLYSLPGVEAMRDRSQSNVDKPPSSSSPSSGSSSRSSSGAKQGTTFTSPSRSASSTSGSGTGSSGRSYNAEQEKGSKEILALGKKSHYKVLGLSNGASSAEVKKAYRKQSLRYHPDKNSAPSAENAFKTINSAYDVLSDKEKRNIYDQVGHDTADQAMSGGGGGGGGGFGGRGFGGSPFGGGHGDLNPEDLFNMFFQGGSGPPRQQRGGRGAQFFHQSFGGGQRAETQHHNRHGQERAGDQESRPQLGQLLQILPMLIIFFLSFGSFGGSQQQQPLFSLHKSPTYLHSMETSMGSHVLPGTPFYASQELWSVHHRKRLSDFDRLKIERDVHNQYSSLMHSNCLKENNRNKRFKSTKDTTKCDELGKFKVRMNDWQRHSQGSPEF